MEKEDGIPVFQLAAPLRHREDDVQDYAAQEIRNAIAFVEKHTGVAWDWKAYFECAKRVNYATKCRQEWLEMNRTEYPQVFGPTWPCIRRPTTWPSAAVFLPLKRRTGS